MLQYRIRKKMEERGMDTSEATEELAPYTLSELRVYARDLFNTDEFDSE